jgi:gliding motility-associated-like protein
MQNIKYKLLILFTIHFSLFTFSNGDIANHLVISEIGINVGGTGDFIEIYNPTPLPVDLKGMKVMYCESGSNTTPIYEWTSSVIIPPKKYYLLANYEGVGADVVFTTVDLLSSGSVAIFLGNTLRIDSVGWGSVSSIFTELSPASSIPAGNSIERKALSTSTTSSMAPGGQDQYKGNGEDNENNSTDFLLRSSPQPQNSSSPAEDYVLPSPITDLRAYSGGGASGGTVDLYWTASGEDGSTGTAKSYIVRYSTTPNFDFNSGSLYSQNWEPKPAGQVESRTVSGLVPGVTYYFKIKTVDTAGNQSLESNEVYAMASYPDTTKPGKITTLTAKTGSKEGEIIISFTATGDDGYQGTAKGYLVKYSKTPITNETEFDSANTFTQNWVPLSAGALESRTLEGLEPDVLYYIAIKAYDDANLYSDMSNVVSAKAQVDITKPATITDLVATSDVDNVRIILSFTAPGDDETIGTAKEYIMKYSLKPSLENPVEISIPYTPSPAGTKETIYIPFSYFPSGKRYYLGIYAKDDKNNVSNISNIVNFYIPLDVTVPAIPTQVKGKFNQNGEFVISWDEVTKNDDGTQITDLAGYKIYKSEDLSSFILIANVDKTLTSYIESNIELGKTYYYFIRAVDKFGNESFNSLVISTDPNKLSFISKDDNVLVNVDIRNSQDLENVVIKIIEKQMNYQNIIKTYEIKAIDSNTLQEKSNFTFYKPNNITFKIFDVNQHFSIYWYDGVNWIKLGGSVSNGTISVKSSKSGIYQLRTTSLSSEFNIVGISPSKIFTPNGDNYNDEIVITYDNPNESVISLAKIYDITGAEIAEFKQGPVGNSLVWDGKDKNNKIVPCGIYLYQIQAEGKTFTGTIIVAK